MRTFWFMTSLKMPMHSLSSSCSFVDVLWTDSGECTVD